MRKLLSKCFRGLLLVIGLVLLYLTNTGALSFNKPYIYRLSREMPAASPLVAFENVNLIPMDSERTLEDQTVIVREGLIETIGDSDQTKIPNGAIVIDGRGK